MKVTGVKVTPYARPPGRIPAGRHANRGCVVELLTDTELTGIAIGVDGAGAQIERFVAEILVGADPRAATELWQRMTDVQAARRCEDLHAATIAVLDVALWDLKAKVNEEPLWRTLGGARPRANLHAGAAAPTTSDQKLADWYGSMARNYGMRGAKLRVGLDEGRDLERLGLMRTALQNGIAVPTLVIDAEQRWTPKQAIGRLRELERQFDVAWVEGATHSWDFPGLKQISNAICGAVCVGGDLATLGEFRPHFHHRSADVIQLDIGAVGITGALELADAAYGFELPVTLAESPGNIHAHLAGVMPYFMSMEVVDPVAQWPVFATDVRIEAGWAIAGDAPGNGLSIDREALRQAMPRAAR